MDRILTQIRILIVLERKIQPTTDHRKPGMCCRRNILGILSDGRRTPNRLGLTGVMEVMPT